MHRIVLALIFMLAVSASASQTGRDEADRMVREAQRRYYQGEVAEARDYWLHALNIYRRIPLTELKQADCCFSIGISEKDLRRPAEAEGYLIRALSLYKGFGGREERQAECHLNIGLVMRSLGRSREAVSHLESAVHLFRKCPGAEKKLAESFLNLGNSLCDSGLPEKSLSYFESALSLYEKIPLSEIPRADCRTGMGSAFLALGKLSEALDCFEKALAQLKPIPHTEKEQAKCIGRKGAILRSLGKPREAAECFRAALSLLRLVPGSEKEQALCHMGIAEILEESGNAAEALKSYRYALSLLEKVGGTERSQAKCSERMGAAHQSLGNFREAAAEFQAAFELNKKISGTEGRQAWDCLSAGLALAQAGRPAEAVQWYGKAISLYSKLGGTDRELSMAHGNLGTALWSLGRPGEAIRHHELALHFSGRIKGAEKQQAVCQMNLGAAMRDVGRTDEAVRHFESAQSLFASIPGTECEQADCDENLGLAFGDLGKLDEAVSYHRKAMSVYERSQGCENRRARCIMNKGAALSSLGRSEEALRDFETALALYRKIPASEKGQANCLVNLGVALRSLGRVEEAVRIYNDAITVYRRIPGTERELADCSGNAGAALAILGRYGEAIERFQCALSVYEKLPGTAKQQAISLTNLGVALRESRKLNESIACLEKALSILENVSANEHLKGRTLAQMGVSKRESNDYDGALRAFRGAIEKADGWWIRIELAETLAGRSVSSTEAFRQYSEALRMIESERVGVRSKEYSISWFEDKVNAYHSFISFLVRDPDRVIDDSGFRDMGATFKEAAFRMSESCRARMLNDLLRKRKPLPKDGKTATILDELHRLGVRLEKLHERRESLKNDMAGAAPEIEAINAEIAGIQRRKNIMEAELDRTELLRLASQSTILDLPQIRKLLDPGCAFLEYVVMDDETLIFAVSRDSLRLYRIPLKSRGGMRYPDTYEEQERWARRARPDRSMGLEGLVHFYRFPMTHYPSPARQETWTEHQKAGRELRGLLLPGQLLEHLTEQKVSHLIIVPDGILNYLPFSSLILSEESAGDYNLEFLINRYSLSFLPSASVLGILREQKEQRRRNRSPRNDLLAFADPVFGGNDERAKGAAEEAGNNGRIALGRLPETRDEAENVAELFPKEKTCILTGFDADERHLREGATCEYRYLLFATHGLIDEDNPPLSCIALSIADPTKPGAQRASPFLTMDKIFGIDLNADLVVLSACETALGKVSRGEGMLGLPLAFFYAGTPSLLASIWKVPSEATAQLSKEFFASLISGNNKAEALRAAQLSLMSRKTFTRSYAHPFFWSAFIVDGDWR